MNRLPFFIGFVLICLSTLFGASLSLYGSSKPKTIVLLKDNNKKPCLVYTGEVKNRIPKGAGNLKYRNEYGSQSKEIAMITGTFDGYKIVDASATIRYGKNNLSFVYKGDIDVYLSEDRVINLTLTDGVINTPSGDLSVNNLSFSSTKDLKALNEVGENTFTREYSCLLEERENYNYIGPFKTSLLHSFGGDFSVTAYYSESGNLEEYIGNRTHFIIKRALLNWADGRTDVLTVPQGEITKDYYGKYVIKGLSLSKSNLWFINNNGDVIAEKNDRDNNSKYYYNKKVFPEGIIEYNSAQKNYDQWHDLPQDLFPYLKNFPDADYYDEKGHHHFFSYGWGTNCTISYSNGSVFNGDINHIDNDNIFTLTSLPDSTMYRQGILTDANGLRTIYYVVYDSWENKQDIRHVGERAFIARSEAARLAREEKDRLDSLEREKQIAEQESLKQSKWYKAFQKGIIPDGTPLEFLENFAELTDIGANSFVVMFTDDDLNSCFNYEFGYVERWNQFFERFDSVFICTYAPVVMLNRSKGTVYGFRYRSFNK